MKSAQIAALQQREESLRSRILLHCEKERISLPTSRDATILELIQALIEAAAAAAHRRSKVDLHESINARDFTPQPQRPMKSPTHNLRPPSSSGGGGMNVLSENSILSMITERENRSKKAHAASIDSKEMSSSKDTPNSSSSHTANALQERLRKAQAAFAAMRDSTKL